MDQITIRKYKSEDHKEVNQVFGKGITDFQHIKDAIINGWQSPSVIAYLTFFFLFGFYFSISYGVFSFLIGIMLQVTSVLICFHWYVW